MNGKRFLILLSLTLSGVAWGQTACPQGVSPGDPRCGPSSGVSGIDMTPPPKGPHWQLTWGAIATSTTAELGATVGHFSRGKAKREAMAICSEKGAKKCRVELAYKNQCAVVAWPSIPGGGVAVQGGPSIEKATQIALQRCAASGGGGCKIAYADCTRPVLVN